MLYVRYGRCDDKCKDEFSKLIESLTPPLPSAMILDLRGNPGGSTPTKTAGHLIAKPIPGYIFRTRCSVSYIEAQIQAASLFQGLSEAEAIDAVVSPRIKSGMLPEQYSQVT